MNIPKAYQKRIKAAAPSAFEVRPPEPFRPRREPKPMDVDPNLEMLLDGVFAY